MQKRQMNSKLKKDQRLLDKSITHWLRLEACKTQEEVIDEGFGTASCALCNEYFREGCLGCPVSYFSGADVCNETPYQEVSDALENYYYMGGAFPTKKVRAQLHFLRMVREALG